MTDKIFYLLKKSINIFNRFPVISERIHEYCLRSERKYSWVTVLYSAPSIFIRYNKKAGKVLLFSLFMLLALRVSAPERQSLYVFEPEQIEPFNDLIHAIGMVETRCDTLAYNSEEKAAGFFQIRPVRLEDYNRRTGSKYTLYDMFNFEISKKIFLYYASLTGPYNFEQIARNWNGSGPRTNAYWKSVKAYL